MKILDVLVTKNTRRLKSALIILFFFPLAFDMAAKPVDSDCTAAVSRMMSQAASVRTVGVGNITFEDKPVSSPLSVYLRSQLMLALGNVDGVIALDRDSLDAVLGEMELAMSGLVDASEVPEMGQLHAAQALLTGQYFDEGTQIRVSLKLTEVQSGVLLAVDQLLIDRRAIPVGIALLPDNFDTAAAVLAELAQVAETDDDSLAIRVWTERGNGGLYYEDEDLVIRFFANRDCYVKVFHIDVNGRMQMIFPNPYCRDNSLDGRQVIIIPDSHYPFRFVLTAPFGVEQIKVVASSLQFNDIDQAFADLGVASGKTATRGLAVRQKELITAEALITYTILHR